MFPEARVNKGRTCGYCLNTDHRAGSMFGHSRQRRCRLNAKNVVRTRAFQFAIRIDSLCESIRFVKKSAFRFTSCHAVFALNKLHKHLKYSNFLIKIHYNPHNWKLYCVEHQQKQFGKFIRLPSRKNRFGSENRIESFFARIGMLYCLHIRAFQFAIRIDSLRESIRFVKKIGLSIH